MKIVRRMRQFIQKITELRGEDRRFVYECMNGMVRRRSTEMTEIGRALGEKIRLIRTVTRLSRMSSFKAFADERLQANFAAEVAPLTKRQRRRFW